MAVLAILRWPDDRLAAHCDPIDEITDDIRTLAADMLETMYAAPGRGLAAPQVGRLVRMFVMDAGWKEGDTRPVVMINPAITSVAGELVEMEEACLSIPGIGAKVLRPTGVTMAWTGIDGGENEAELEGAEARIAQHEYDHLDGIVTLDRIAPEARAAALAAYAP